MRATEAPEGGEVGNGNDKQRNLLRGHINRSARNRRKGARRPHHHARSKLKRLHGGRADSGTGSPNPAQNKASGASIKQSTHVQASRKAVVLESSISQRKTTELDVQNIRRCGGATGRG